MPLYLLMSYEADPFGISVIKPAFTFEGTKKTETAKYQLERIQEISDDTIVLNNQDLLNTSDKKKTFDEAFEEFHKLIEARLLNER